MKEKRVYKIDYILKINGNTYNRTCYIESDDKLHAIKCAGYYIQATTGIVPIINDVDGINEILIIKDVEVPRD
jgi:hypothetical protein